MLNFNLDFFTPLFESLFGIIFSILYGASNHQILIKKNYTEFLLKLSGLKSEFTLTLGYLNPALNNPAQSGRWGGGETIDEVWNLGTMFSQLAKRSTHMLVSGIFKQPEILVVVPDVLSKFSKIIFIIMIENVFFFR